MVISRHWSPLSNAAPQRFSVLGLCSVPHQSGDLVYFLVLLRDVVDYLQSANFEQNPTIYLHAGVICPFPVVHHALFRFYMYDLFWFNTPSELYSRISHIKFRFSFLSTTTVPRQEIFVENLRFTTTFSNPVYYDLNCEQ